jgi:formiminoglutamase
MSGASSSAAAWSTHLEPPHRVEDLFRRPDDPRLGEIIAAWNGDVAALTAGRAVLIGFPQDEGVRRNHGRPGAAEAPHEIRQRLFRLTPYDGPTDTDLTGAPPLDLGNIRVRGSLEESQQALGAVVAAVLERGAVPVVLGGGHETAYGHYLGYAALRRKVGIINLDAHLDVRPCPDGRGHSGSPFRQAMEHVEFPLPGSCYVCLGAEPSAVAREHLQYVQTRGGTVWWAGHLPTDLELSYVGARDLLTKTAGQVYVTLDADVVAAAAVPGVSAPNPNGLSAAEVLGCVRVAGRSPAVSSFDLVEINPRLDPDGRSTRWAALAIWNFLMGVAEREKSPGQP